MAGCSVPYVGCHPMMSIVIVRVIVIAMELPCRQFEALCRVPRFTLYPIAVPGVGTGVASGVHSG